MENVQQHDVKDEAIEKHFKAELLDLEEAPLGRVGKLRPINSLFFESGAMSTPTKSPHPTVLSQGGLASTQ